MAVVDSSAAVSSSRISESPSAKSLRVSRDAAAGRKVEREGVGLVMSLKSLVFFLFYDEMRGKKQLVGE